MATHGYAWLRMATHGYAWPRDRLKRALSPLPGPGNSPDLSRTALEERDFGSEQE